MIYFTAKHSNFLLTHLAQFQDLAVQLVPVDNCTKCTFISMWLCPVQAKRIYKFGVQRRAERARTKPWFLSDDNSGFLRWMVLVHMDVPLFQIFRVRNKPPRTNGVTAG